MKADKDKFRSAKEEFPAGTGPESAIFQCHKCKKTFSGREMRFADAVNPDYERLQLCVSCSV